jgi:hypothetical protein
VAVLVLVLVLLLVLVLVVAQFNLMFLSCWLFSLKTTRSSPLRCAQHSCQKPQEAPHQHRPHLAGALSDVSSHFHKLRLKKQLQSACALQAAAAAQ